MTGGSGGPKRLGWLESNVARLGGIMRIPRLSECLLGLVFGLALLLSGELFAGVTASISGTVTDTSGAVVAGVPVIVTNVDTGISKTQTTNGQGFYSFQALPL